MNPQRPRFCGIPSSKLDGVVPEGLYSHQNTPDPRVDTPPARKSRRAADPACEDKKPPPNHGISGCCADRILYLCSDKHRFWLPAQASKSFYLPRNTRDLVNFKKKTKPVSFPTSFCHLLPLGGEHRCFFLFREFIT